MYQDQTCGIRTNGFACASVLFEMFLHIKSIVNYDGLA